MKYLFKKDDRTVTISKVEDKWNYRKEFGSTLIDNFNFTEDKISGFIAELIDIGYKRVNKPAVTVPQCPTVAVPNKNKDIFPKPNTTLNVKELKLPENYKQEQKAYKTEIEKEWLSDYKFFQPPTLQTMVVPSDGKTITLEYIDSGEKENVWEKILFTKHYNNINFLKKYCHKEVLKTFNKPLISKCDKETK